MKKKLIYLLCGLLFMAGCEKKEDNIFSKSPDERLYETLNEYQDILDSSPNGWLLSVNTGLGGGYRFWLSFNSANRVTMLSDLDYDINTAGETSRTPQESSYRLKSLQAPSILFDTYNYLHILADPQKDMNGGEKAEGLKSDFEFSFIKEDNGMLYLKGNFNSCAAYMERVTPEEAEFLSKGGLKSVYKGMEDYLNTNKFPSIQVGETKMMTKPNSRKTEFAYMDKEENIIEKSIGSYLDLNYLIGDKQASDVHFFEPIEILGETFTGMAWDKSKECYVMQGEKGAYDVFDNGVPPYPLNFGLNQTFSKLYVDANAMQGTIPQKFMDQVYTPASNALYGNGKRTIVYVTSAFTENSTSGKPQMTLVVRYANSAGKEYSATWYYSYKMNDDGTITFLDREQNTSNSNTAGQEPYLRPIPDFFCKIEYSHYDSKIWSASVKSKITPHTLRIDWAPNKTSGLTGNIGGLYRTDDEELYIAGQLQQK